MFLTKIEYELEKIFLKKMGLTAEEIEGYFEMFGLKIIEDKILN